MRRVVEALDMLGQPLSDTAKMQVERAISKANPSDGLRALQEALDHLADRYGLTFVVNEAAWISRTI